MQTQHRMMSHAEYVASDRWKVLREAVLKRDGYKCRVCPRQTGLQVHHLSYPKTWGDDSEANLITLCAAHHMNRHGIIHGRHIADGIAAFARYMASELGER